jgi:hypothetical protein
VQHHGVINSEILDLKMTLKWSVCYIVAVHLFHHYHKRTESTLFHNHPLPLKVWYKSSEQNYDGGRFHEIKHADPGS